MSDLKKAAQTTVSKPVKMGDFTNLFSKYQLQIEQIAPKKGIQSNRIIALAAQVFAASPALQQCEPASMIAAVMQAAMMGLNPTPQWGEIYFVPYGGKVQMQVGYQGWIKLAHKSGCIKTIRAVCIYDGDAHSIELGTDDKILHQMGPNFGNPAKVVAAYAVAELASGGKQSIVLNHQMIERLRLKSPMQNNRSGTGLNGPWKTDYDKMAQAKAIKQLLKMIPREDEWRSFDFADESIASLETIDRGDFEYPIEQEGSAEVVEMTDDEKAQAAFDAQMEKEAKNA